MKRWIVMLMLVAVLAVCFAGCSGEWPFKWKPTEDQRQAADLTVADLDALPPFTDDAGKPILDEARVAARTTQAYMGLPKNRPRPVNPTNQPMLTQAATDANRPGPTPGEVGTAIVNEAAQVTTSGFALADLLLTAGGTVAGLWGLNKAKGRFDGWKNRATGAEGQIGLTLQALREVVQGIDQLTPEIKATVKAAQRQSRETERLVADARKS